MKMKKIVLILMLLPLLVCFYCQKDTPVDTGAEKGDTKPTADAVDKKIVLEINEKKFTNNDFKMFLHIQYGDISNSKEKSSSNPTEKIISRLFDSFVEHQTVLYIANQHNIPIDTTELDDYISKLNVPGNNIDKAAVIEAIKVQKFLYSKVYEPVTVTEGEIRDYYNNHLEEFRKKPEVFLYQILTKNKESALRIRGQLDNNPQQFEEIARKESASMEAKKGGEMGYFEEGTLPKDMEQVVFSLKTNTISPVVESAYGFHIFKITEKKRGRLLYLEKVKPEIRQKLMSEKLRNAYRDFLATANQDLTVTVKYDALYFNYQIIKGDNGDEIKKTINSNNGSDSSG